MRNTSLVITILHLLSPISAVSAEIKSYINTLRFGVCETFQINQSNFQLFNNAFVWIATTQRFSYLYKTVRSNPVIKKAQIKGGGVAVTYLEGSS